MLDRLTTAVLYYLIFTYAILETKPSLIFNYDGKPKPFGFNKDNNETPFSLLTVLVLGGLTIYYFLVRQGIK